MSGRSTRFSGAGAALLAGLAAAQAPPPTPPPWLHPSQLPPVPRFVERVELTIGNVDITVLDAAGNLVTDLIRDDFVLFVDGVATPIANFGAFAVPAHPTPASTPAAKVAAPAVPAEPAAAESPPARPGIVVIFIDSANTTLFDRNHLLPRLDAWLAASLHPPDRAFVAVYQEYLRFLTPLTADPAEVRAALEGLLRTSAGVGSTQTWRRVAERQLRDLAETSSATSRGPAFDQAVMTARANAAQMLAATRQALDAFKVLLRTLSGVPGRKAVLYVSDGLPRAPGRETYDLLLELFPQATWGDTEPLVTDATELYEELARWAAAADVTLYTIDARGLEAGGSRTAEHGGQGHRTLGRPPREGASDLDAAARRNYQEPLEVMAALTGGVAIVNTNEFERGLARVAQAMATTYSLGFELQPGKGNAVHGIRVAVKGRAGLRLRYRTSLVTRTLATRVEDRTVAGLAFDLRENPLGVRVEVGRPVAAAKKRYSLPIRILLPAGNLVFLPRGDALAARIVVFTAAAGPEGRRTPVGRAEHAIEVAAERLARVGTIAVESSLEVGEGPWRVSVGVLDEQGGVASYAGADATVGQAR